MIVLYVDGNSIWDKKEKSSAIDFIPPIGSVIKYQKFRSNKNMQPGELIVLKVESIEFYTEEFWNSTYKDKMVHVHCSLINP